MRGYTPCIRLGIPVRTKHNSVAAQIPKHIGTGMFDEGQEPVAWALKPGAEGHNISSVVGVIVVTSISACGAWVCVVHIGRGRLG